MNIPVNFPLIYSAMNRTCTDVLAGCVRTLGRKFADITFGDFLIQSVIAHKKCDIKVALDHYGIDYDRTLHTIELDRTSPPDTQIHIHEISMSAWIVTSLQQSRLVIRSGDMLLAALSHPRVARGCGLTFSHADFSRNYAQILAKSEEADVLPPSLLGYKGAAKVIPVAPESWTRRIGDAFELLVIRATESINRSLLKTLVVVIDSPYSQALAGHVSYQVCCDEFPAFPRDTDVKYLYCEEEYDHDLATLISPGNILFVQTKVTNHAISVLHSQVVKAHASLILL